MVKQFEFVSLFQMNGARPKYGMIMGENGVTTAKITRNVNVTHDSKKGGRVEVVFLTDQKHFQLQTDQALKDFVDLYRNIYADSKKLPSIEQHILTWCVYKNNVRAV